MNLSDVQNSLRDCAICPRRCHADRIAGRLGWCRTGAGVAIGSICIHHGEEPVIGGPDGICNVFFARCNLQCVYCQNYQISRNDGPVAAEELTVSEAAERIRGFLAGGVRRVGFVSPSHCIPQMEALMEALWNVDCGMRIAERRPVFVMNTNGYDCVETLRRLEGRMDVYLPDLKYMDSALAERLSGAADYPQVAAAALREMFRQKGANIRLAEDGAIECGLVVRHLVLPGQVENSKACLRFVAEELSPSVHLSLLAQYRPTPAVAGDADLGRPLRPGEYEEVLDEMERLGFYRGWTQQLSSAENYNPDFQKPNPFE